MKELLGFDLGRVVKRSEGDLPLYASPVEAGFPSPANDYLETVLDLNEFLVQRPAATFLVRVQGDSMKDAGILDGSILVVDSSIEPQSGMIVLAIVDNEFTVKRLVKVRKTWTLQPENPDYSAIKVTKNTEIRGVITASIQKFGSSF
ncbi:MAG: translesion error-prone DNA polymerase V autoproteolytic subunit [Paracoccaceae bacterium]|nr:translesion error-prone DNA polymerase V autoproteolytic subunit [Paracoccaceae bacterium]MCY4100683.1 translesion error-prone DNA polymerase V autoproteolytic subunit [Paracoccaceae bacterium]MDE2674908.1 translesion error-prone DNA polymerase V autoproteolytic subunit [Paracoccaceae bacterium]MDE2738331.1 translesion error-prone DNA polymerase V autoproteolytic subunit [Paracoccaceae bacterium]